MDDRAAAYLRDLGIAEQGLAGWDVEVAQRAGVDVAVVVTRGPEIHMVAIAEKKAMSRRNTLDFLRPLLERFGYATTRVPIEITDHRLRETLGFKYTWRDDNFTYWALTELPFQKG